MKPVHSLFSLICLSSLLAAQDQPGPELSIGFEDGGVVFRVSGMEGVFLGGVIVSLSPQLAHHLQGLPPMLADFAVVGVGATFEQYSIEVPNRNIPRGVKIYAQGLAADVTIQSTAVGSFRLGAGGSDG